MKLLYSLIFAILLVFSNQIKAGWKLVWEDDFLQNDYLDTSKWSFINRNYVNPPLNWKTVSVNIPSCVKVVGGNVELTAFVDDNHRAIGCGITTKKKKSVKYGKVEVKAKFESAQGINSAIWMLADNPQYEPNNPIWIKNTHFNGEMDIVEHINFDSNIYQTIHTYFTHSVKGVKLPVSLNPPNMIKIKKNVSDYVVYGVEIYADKIIYFVDGQKTFEYQKTTLDKKIQFPFDQAYYLMLEQGIGTVGSWQGPVNLKNLPVKMSIDWVKFYEKAV